MTGRPIGFMASQVKVAASQCTPPEGSLSYVDFLAWADEDTYAEWIDGDVIVMSPASLRHQQVVGFLEKILGTYAEEHDLGVVLSAPFQMKLENGREPDLLFVKREHASRLQETYLDGPADVAVEIVSPESVGRDRGDKFYEYAQGGVPEYWLVDPQMQWVECYRLEGERYRPAFSGEEGTYHSDVVEGFWFEAEWLWQEPLPRVLEVLRAYGMI